jgi:hypothetical protein
MGSPTPIFSRRISILGLATVLAAEDADLLQAMCAAYSDWPETSAPEVGLELRLGYGADVDGLGGGVVDIGINGQRLTLRGAGQSGWADAGSGRAEARVARGLPGDPSALTELVDTLLLFLLARAGRTPVHAAGVVIGGVALVLAGPSGAGKSTLALRALQRGLPILSDDTVYIQLRPDLRVWGFRRPLHVFPDEAPRFTTGTRLRAGRLKAVVPAPPAGPGPPVADRAALVVLSRGEAVALDPLDPAEALAALSRLDAGFDLLAEASAEAVAALAGRGAWRLTLTRDPEAALDLLCARFQHPAARQPPD